MPPTFKPVTVADKARRRAEIRAAHVYHVSPSRNRDSILEHGIEPVLFSRGKRRTCWYVDAERVMWAIVHVCCRHNVQLDQVDIWLVPASLFRKLENTSMRGVYQSQCSVRVKTHMSAFIAAQKQAEWLEFLS